MRNTRAKKKHENIVIQHCVKHVSESYFGRSGEVTFQSKRNSGGVTWLRFGTDDERWLELMTYRGHDIEEA